MCSSDLQTGPDLDGRARRLLPAGATAARHIKLDDFLTSNVVVNHANVQHVRVRNRDAEHEKPQHVVQVLSSVRMNTPRASL